MDSVYFLYSARYSDNKKNVIKYHQLGIKNFQLGVLYSQPETKKTAVQGES